MHWRLLSGSLMTLILLALLGCGSNGNLQRPAAPEVAGNQPAADAEALPWPPTAQAEASARRLSGASVSSGSGFAECSGSGTEIDETRLNFDPSADRIAWAIYQFAPEEEQQIKSLAYEASGLGAFEQFWLAIADFESGRWRFLAPQNEPVANIELTQSENLRSGNGLVYAAVIAFDEDDFALKTLSLVYPNQRPQADIEADVTSGYAPLMRVQFDASASSDEDGEVVAFEWDPLGSGVFNGKGSSPLHVFQYQTPGQYQARVKVYDDAGGVRIASVPIIVKDEILEPPVVDDDDIPENHPPYCDWWFVNPGGDQTTSGPPETIVYVQFEDSFDPDEPGAPKTARGIHEIWCDVGADGTWELYTQRNPGEGTTMGPLSFPVTTQVRVKVASFDGWETMGDTRTFAVIPDPPKGPEPPGPRPEYQENIDWSWYNTKSFGTGWSIVEYFGTVVVPVDGVPTPIPVGYVRGMSHKNCIELGIAAHYAYELGYLEDDSLALKFIAVSQKHNPEARTTIEAAGQAAVDYAVDSFGFLNDPMGWILAFHEFLAGGIFFNLFEEWFGWFPW